MPTWVIGNIDKNGNNRSTDPFNLRIESTVISYRENARNGLSKVCYYCRAMCSPFANLPALKLKKKKRSTLKASKNAQWKHNSDFTRLFKSKRFKRNKHV